MSSEFASELVIGWVLIAISALCIFGRDVWIEYSIRENEKMLARLLKNPLPARIAICLFGVFYICVGIYEGLFDKTNAIHAGLWPAFFIGSLGISCFILAMYVVPIQMLNLRLRRSASSRRAGRYTLLSVGVMLGCIGIAFLADLFFTK